jgi:hypothetical protein
VPGRSSGGAVGAEIEVVYGYLHSTAARLRSALTVLEEVTSQRQMLTRSASAAGDPSVAEAITSFVAAWTSGLSGLESDGETLAGDLVGAASRYRQLEAALSRPGPAGGR